MTADGLRRIRRMKDMAWWRCPACGHTARARDADERICGVCLIEMDHHGTRRPEETNDDD